MLAEIRQIKIIRSPDREAGLDIGKAKYYNNSMIVGTI
jgi:hypothetical protein